MEQNKPALRIIEQCARELSYQTAAERGIGGPGWAHSPKCPLVHVFWDGVSEQGEEVVRSVFRELWPSGALAGTLVEFMHGIPDTEQFRTGILDHAVGLLKNEFIPEKGEIHITHYVSLSSPQLEEQIDCICRTHSTPVPGLYGTIFPLVVLINDLPPAGHGDGMKKTREMFESKLSGILNLRVMALGNFLGSGALLDDSQADENYRIAADVSFLAAAAPNPEGLPSGVQGWIIGSGEEELLTAGYLLMQKPNKRIAVVTLKALLEKRIQAAELRSRELESKFAHKSAGQFFAAIGINAKCLDLLDDAFERHLRDRMPRPQDLEPLYNWKKAKKAAGFSAANAETAGALRLFAERYFTVREEMLGFDTDALAGQFAQDLLAKCDYRFARDHFDVCADFLNAEELRPAPHPDIYEGAVDFARRDFYALMAPKFASAVRRCAAQAEAFDKTLQEFQSLLKLPPELLAPGLISVGDFYQSQADLLLNEEKLRKTLAPCADEKETLAEILAAFQELVQSAPSVYRASLQQEIGQRTVRNRDGSARDVIAPALSASLDGKQRMMLTHVGAKNEFYLYQGDALFGPSLPEEAQKVKTDCMDRAEHLQLCRFKPESIIM